MTDDIQPDPQTYAIFGAAMAVHRELGPGFLEAVYHEAMCRELAQCGIAHSVEVSLPLRYRGQLLSTTYRADLICGDILVELKATSTLARSDGLQVVNYLKASGLTRGLLLGFGSPSLQFRRYIHSRGTTRPTLLA